MILKQDTFLKLFLLFFLFYLLFILNGCSSEINKKLKQCDNEAILRQPRYFCYMTVAAEYNSTKVCDKIPMLTSSGTFTGSKLDCYIWLAELNRDTSLCDSITHQEAHDICYIKVVARMGNISLCEKLYDVHYSNDFYPKTDQNLTTKQSCYRSANREPLADYSTLFDDEEEEQETQEPKVYDDNYYFNEATKLRDASLCDYIKSDGPSMNKFKCYSRVAQRTRDASLCASISSVEQRDDCYLGIVIMTFDQKLCEKVSQTQDEFEETTRKDKCYHVAAIGLHNDVICQNIVDEVEQEKCNTDVAFMGSKV